MHWFSKSHPSVVLNANLKIDELAIGMVLTHRTGGGTATLVYLNHGTDQYLLIGADGELSTLSARVLKRQFCKRTNRLGNPNAAWIIAQAAYRRDTRLLTRLGFRAEPSQIRAALMK